MKKYEFTGKTMQYDGCTLHQIRALRDLYINSNPNHPNPKPDVTTAIRVHAGDIGGWIQSKDNLSHEGNCWVDHNAKVYGHASVKDNAYVGGEAIVCCSTIAENARVLDNADVNEDSVVFGNAIICDSAVVKGHSKIYGDAVIRIKAQVYYSEIYGGTEITGSAKMCFQKLCNGGWYFESRFGYKKYEFTGKTIEYEGHTLHQIRALRDLFISSHRSKTNNIYVNVGDIGGWIWSEDNLSHEGDCWVDQNVKVYGYASIEDNAYVGNEATICGATISGNARVVGNANVIGFTKVFGNALIGESAVVKGRSKIYGDATIMGTAKVANSDISGSATIRGTIEVYCKTLCKGLYDCDDDFREKRPEKRSYDEPFLPVDNSLSSVERRAIERRRIAWCLGRYEDLLWDDL